MLRSTIMSKMSEALAESKYRFKQLQEIDVEIPWTILIEQIEPDYLDADIGQNIVSVETMLRIYFLQLRYGMNPSGVEEALFQIEVLREFALIDMKEGVIPSQTCINRFNKMIYEKNHESEIMKVFELEAKKPR